METVVSTHGEVLAQKVITREVLVKDSETWLIIYAKLVQAMLDLNGNEVKVLLWCALEAKVNTNEVVLARHIKLRMSAEIGLGIGSIDNALGQLVTKEFLKRTGRGVYHVDPDSTWRGDLKSRAKNIQVFLTYKVEQP
jgi:hypothetical protein